MFTLSVDAEGISAEISQPILKVNKDYFEQDFQDNSVQNTVNYYAQKYRVSGKEMLAVLRCESGLKHEGIYGDHGLAYGIAQFHEATFNSFQSKSGLDLNYRDQNNQIELMAWAFANNLKSHWTCATKNGIL